MEVYGEPTYIATSPLSDPKFITLSLDLNPMFDTYLYVVQIAGIGPSLHTHYIPISDGRLIIMIHQLFSETLGRYKVNAKIGTILKKVRLVEDNTDQIEGKIEGQVIVILTKFVRKQG